MEFLRKLALVAIAGLILTACGKSIETSPAAKAEKAPATEDKADYEEGKGLALGETARRTAGLSFATTEMKPLRSEFTFAAQVYRAASEASGRFGKEMPGHAYATAWIDSGSFPVKVGGRLRIDFPGSEKSETEGTVWRLVDIARQATGKEELLLEIPDSGGRLTVGDSVLARIDSDAASSPVLVVPQSAVLHAASGTSVYLDRDGRLLRVPVSVGREAGGMTEILSGLAVGDRIAASGVDALYLIELRFTKGGGDAD